MHGAPAGGKMGRSPPRDHEGQKQTSGKASKDSQSNECLERKGLLGGGESMPKEGCEAFFDSSAHWVRLSRFTARALTGAQKTRWEQVAGWLGPEKPDIRIRHFYRQAECLRAMALGFRIFSTMKTLNLSNSSP